MDEEVPLLEVRHLDKIYENGYHADRDVSFSIPSGKLVGLIGPNGCGKTTMMRCINKMHMLTSGDILIDGESVIPKTPTEVAKLVSNVPAEMTASFGLTVFETVMLGRYPYLQNMWWETEEDETLVEETLKKFGVHHLQDRALNMLSSGEQQRVLIAKAYVQEPRLMLVDEPTSHLDMKFKMEVMEYLKAMVLYIAHDMTWTKEIEDFCVWAFHYDMWCKCHFFGEELSDEKAAEKKIKKRRGRQNMLNLLPECFSVEDAAMVREQCGLDEANTKGMLALWTHRGYIEQDTTGRYTKTEHYLSRVA